MMRHKYLKYLVIFSVIFILAGFLVLRYQYYFRYYDEIKFAREFWTLLITEDNPTEQWKNYLNKYALDRGADAIFYGLKVWFIDFSPVSPDEDLLRGEYASRIYETIDGQTLETDVVGVEFKYGDESQRLHAAVKKENGQFKLYPSLSLDNCFWSPDVDENGVIDQKDVELAKQKRAKGSKKIIDSGRGLAT
jgi:hypothetical protein